MTVQFAGGTDRDSLTVQDDYIFLQVLPLSEEAARFQIKTQNFKQCRNTVIVGAWRNLFQRENDDL